MSLSLGSVHSSHGRTRRTLHRSRKLSREIMLGIWRLPSLNYQPIEQKKNVETVVSVVTSRASVSVCVCGGEPVFSLLYLFTGLYGRIDGIVAVSL